MIGSNVNPVLLDRVLFTFLDERLVLLCQVLISMSLSFSIHLR
jgi:hypothetical protein